jgi:hypothetical protein
MTYIFILNTFRGIGIQNDKVGSSTLLLQEKAGDEVKKKEAASRCLPPLLAGY